MNFAGHCYRHPELPASKLVLWEPKQGQAQRGRGHLTYIDLLRRDTGFVTAGQKSACMTDKEFWGQLRPAITSLTEDTNQKQKKSSEVDQDIISFYSIISDGTDTQITLVTD